MTARRGLTLIELLAAIVLLAILAATAAPVLRGAGAGARPAPESLDIVALGDAADESMRSGEAPEPPVVVRRVPAEGGEWVDFSCGELHVIRWVSEP